MSAVKALWSARERGVVVEISGGDLILAASTEPPRAVLDDLARYKQEIIGILTPSASGLSAEDWLTSFDERAGIAEFDGGLPRELAELQAIGSCVLDPAMSKTDGRQVELFVRSLPDHIARARSRIGSGTSHSASDPGEWGISETTP